MTYLEALEKWKAGEITTAELGTVVVESCVDVKQQSMVSLTRLAEILGTTSPDYDDRCVLVDSRKAQL
ncbi:conserved hypothetical protein [Vibrio phage 150E35-1]|nr:conserved hypothetical protein [Vibrio phage 150E35-1]